MPSDTSQGQKRKLIRQSLIDSCYQPLYVTTTTGSAFQEPLKNDLFKQEQQNLQEHHDVMEVANYLSEYLPLRM